VTVELDVDPSGRCPENSKVASPDFTTAMLRVNAFILGSRVGDGTTARTCKRTSGNLLVMSSRSAAPGPTAKVRTSSRLKKATARLRDSDPTLAKVIAANPDFDPRAWLADLPPLDAFATLLFQVIGQQLSVTATRRILAHIYDSFGGHLPGPEEVLAAAPDQLRRAGLSRRKVETVRTIAAQFRDGMLSDELFGGLCDEEIEDRLTTIPGVGPWTVHGFLIVALDRPDVVLPGDLALRKVIRQLYGFDHLPTPAEVLAIAERWRPYRSLATAYLFASAFAPGSDRR